MKKVVFTAIAFVAVVSGAFASIYTPAVKQPANVYTYYLEGECDIPVNCSPEYTGAVCSEEFEGRIVYDAQGCQIGHETTNIIGRKAL